MNVSAAVVIGAALIAGSMAWSADWVARDARCIGYLASNSGGDALMRVAAAMQKAPKAGSLDEECFGETPATTNAKPYLAGLQMVGCRLDEVVRQ